MTQPGETRVERKERTRRAILDAALQLSQPTTLAAVSLRQVAKEVGIVPTAFYRHFTSVEELGLALVEESFESLRTMLRDVRRGQEQLDGIIGVSVRILGDHVRAQRDHFRFLVRERQGGSPVLREAVRRELGYIERELATDLAQLAGAASYSSEDLQVAANLVVNNAVMAVEELLEASGPAAERVILDRFAAQLLMLTVGAVHWRRRPER